MKKIGEYTTRGTVTSDDSTNRIILFDGRFDTAYRVVEFRIGPNEVTGSTGVNLSAKLMTFDNGLTGTNWNWENNGEIAWALMAFDGNDPRMSADNFHLIDPDNLVVEALYIRAADQQGSDVKCNYFIRMEKYDITEWQGALSMVRNRSQA